LFFFCGHSVYWLIFAHGQQVADYGCDEACQNLYSSSADVSFKIFASVNTDANFEAYFN